LRLDECDDVYEKKGRVRRRHEIGHLRLRHDLAPPTPMTFRSEKDGQLGKVGVSGRQFRAASFSFETCKTGVWNCRPSDVQLTVQITVLIQ